MLIVLNRKNRPFGFTFGFINYGLTIGSLSKSDYYIKMDNISFDLMGRAGISTNASDVDVLETRMEQSYSFILNNQDYFFTTYAKGETLYEMDMKLSQAARPDKLITNYVNNYKMELENYNKNAPLGTKRFSKDEILGYSNNFKNFLYDWKSRWNSLNNFYDKDVD